jgi:hypothetical protein
MFRCTNLGVIIFYSIRFLSKKKIKPIFLLKKPKPVQTDRFRFGFLGQKPVQTGLARFWLSFFLFGSVFSLWFGFLPV